MRNKNEATRVTQRYPLYGEMELEDMILVGRGKGGASSTLA